MENKELRSRIVGRLENLCSKRECCSSDIYKKAKTALSKASESEAGLDVDAEAAAILSELVDGRYVDDLRYSCAFAREKASISGWGPIKIRYALTAKGIGREIADAALEEIEQPRADNRLEKLLENKWRSLEGDPQAKLKLLRFALSRGYEYEVVRKAVDKLGI